MNTIEIIGTAIAIVATILGGVWFIIRLFVKSELKEYRLKIIEGSVSNLPCNEHGLNITNIKAETNTRLASIENKIDRWDDAMTLVALSNSKTVRKKSPYKLTSVGEYLLDVSGGRKCIDNNEDYYFGEIEKKQNSTLFDVEKASIRSVMDSFNTDVANDVKNYIYATPDSLNVNLDGEDERIDVKLIDIQIAMAIYLRDKYIKRQALENENS